MTLFDSFFPPAFASNQLDEERELSGGGGATACGCGHAAAPDSRTPGHDARRERTLNAWTLERPETVAVFRELGLDACCGGGRSLAEACALHGLDLEEVLDRLDAA